ncbi:MAG: glycoside hydrolase family 43 protein [Bacteroidales bacterium]|nr:glycoside hydrolase family 43 protein [Bacteroidales bacterium]
MKSLFLNFIFLFGFIFSIHTQQGDVVAPSTTLPNPVIPGFNPDPSVCRVGDDYYLVTSTFEYFPGVPVYHSKDLINWEHIGYCLTRNSQLPLDNCRSSGGIYAPTIRYNKGTFYMVTTNVSGKGNFYVHTQDPAGEWSEPVWVNQGGIDPTLFFDDDGKNYLVTNAMADGKTGIALSEIDLATGDILSPIQHIWGGTGGRYPEAPHIYKINGWYYLMIAEGGTEYGHMETIARSKSIWGPYESNPDNPILTHRGLPGQYLQVQGTGHADIIEAHDGSWWMVFLAFRKAGGDFHHLGRETFLTPVTWNEQGWPVVSADDIVSPDIKVKTLPLVSVARPLVRDEFDKSQLNLCWNFLRNPDPATWSLAERPGFLTLAGNSVTLDQSSSPAFVGRRQQHFNCTATAKLEFEPSAEGETAGITVLMNEKHHYDLHIIREGEKKCITLSYRIGNLKHVAFKAPLPEGPVQFRITAEPLWYTFSYLPAGASEFIPAGKMESRYLSSEVAGGFTGVYLGMFAEGNAKSKATPAYFDWFDYDGKD